MARIGLSGPRPPRQNCTENARVVLGVAATQLLQRCVLQTIFGRIKRYSVSSPSRPPTGSSWWRWSAHPGRHHHGKSGRDRRAPRRREPSLSHDRVSNTDSEDFTRAGFVMGTQVVESGRMPSRASRAHVAHCRVEGHRKQERDAGLASAFGDCGNGTSRRIPRASRTSAEPDLEVDARLPCLTTVAPVPAMTRPPWWRC